MKMDMNYPANEERVVVSRTFKRSTTVIAEIGENHLGDMEIAAQLIEAVKEAGADYAKFQSYRAEDFPLDHPEREWFKQVALSDDDHAFLLERCDKVGIRFLSAPATLERARFLVERLGQRELKLASNRLRDEAIQAYLGSQRLDRIFLSTGNSTIVDIQRAADRLRPSGAEIVVLHCVSLYPTSPSEANLRAIPHLRNELGLRVGYSDHTIGTLACEVAVALGAQVIEKHITMDRAWTGSDHILSCEPGDLAGLMSRIAKIEQMLGEEAKHPSPREKRTLGAA